MQRRLPFSASALALPRRPRPQLAVSWRPSRLLAMSRWWARLWALSKMAAEYGQSRICAPGRDGGGCSCSQAPRKTQPDD
eukprot:10525673-Alexandrium_andersonii.AAC.1